MVFINIIFSIWVGGFSWKHTSRHQTPYSTALIRHFLIVGGGKQEKIAYSTDSEILLKGGRHCEMLMTLCGVEADNTEAASDLNLKFIEILFLVPTRTAWRRKDTQIYEYIKRGPFEGNLIRSAPFFKNSCKIGHGSGHSNEHFEFECWLLALGLDIHKLSYVLKEFRQETPKRSSHCHMFGVTIALTIIPLPHVLGSTLTHRNSTKIYTLSECKHVLARIGWIYFIGTTMCCVLRTFVWYILHFYLFCWSSSNIKFWTGKIYEEIHNANK